MLIDVTMLAEEIIDKQHLLKLENNGGTAWIQIVKANFWRKLLHFLNIGDYNFVKITRSLQNQPLTLHLRLKPEQYQKLLANLECINQDIDGYNRSFLHFSKLAPIEKEPFVGKICKWVLT